MTDQNQTVRNIGDLIDQGIVAKPSRDLAKEDKENIGRSENDLVLREAQLGEGDEGSFYAFSGTLNGEPVTFRLGANGKRDLFLDSITHALTDGPIGGLRFRTYDGGKGQPRVEIERAQ